MSYLMGQNCPMSIDMVIARNVDELMRRNRELGSQVLLSKKTGVATSTVGRIRRGEVSPTADSLDAIAKAFGMEAGDLMDKDLIKRLNAMSSSNVQRINRIVQQLKSGQIEERQLKVIEATLEIE